MDFKGFAVFLPLALGMPGAAAAQNPLVLERLRQMDAAAPAPGNEAIKAAVTGAAASYAQAKGTCAPSEVTIDEVSPITGAGVILPAVMSGRLRNGWSVYATHKGCPGIGPFRYMILQKGDGSLVSAFVNEGKAYANPTIMRDTSAQAALAAAQKAKGLDPTCTGDPMEMGATRIASQSDDLGPQLFGVRYVGSWTEIWRFETCGRSFEVPIQFTPDGDGGAYTRIKAQEVAVAP